MHILAVIAGQPASPEGGHPLRLTPATARIVVRLGYLPAWPQAPVFAPAFRSLDSELRRLPSGHCSGFGRASLCIALLLIWSRGVFVLVTMRSPSVGS